jgi:hypothetical protein
MSEKTELDDYICGGYFLTTRITRPPFLSNLVPDSVVTLSTCFTDIAPDTWADADYKYDDEERVQAALKFGIPASAVPELVTMFTQAVMPQHLTNAFPNLSIAQDFYRSCADKALVVLVGLGLERSLVPTLLAQLHDDPNRGYGLVERVNANAPLERGGKVLGYEPLGFEATKFHSWLCHNAPVEGHNRFGILPNSEGFIDSFADAVRITQDLKATGAETSIWEPWLVVQYGSGEESRLEQ